MRAILMVGALVLSACASPAVSHNGHAAPAAVQAAPGPDEAPAFGARVEAPLLSAANARIGQIELRQGAKGVLMVVEVSPGALTPGWHGAHIHLRGDCSDPAAGFKASGAHLGHGGADQHGLLNPLGPETGDLPNLFAPASGPFGAEFYIEGVALAPVARGGVQPLLGPNGAAFIIHAARDDHASQPIGAAGARVACAVIAPADGAR
jgi:Cu-Zn family superoxide dismutase